MTSGVVYDGVARGTDEEDDAGEGAQASEKLLFSGLKLWFSHSVPQRSWLVENAKANGAQIVPLEKQANVLLVDHARKNQAPGTTSYRYVEMSIRKGELEDIEDHRVGAVSGSTRPVGSVVTASKGTRAAYTEADDQFLWNMVKPYMDRGGTWKGNAIYQQIQEMNPRHPYQSWRDRWIKHTQYQRREITEQMAYQEAQIPAATQPPATVARQPMPLQSGPADTAERSNVRPSSSAPAPAQHPNSPQKQTLPVPTHRPSSPISLPVNAITKRPASTRGATPCDANSTVTNEEIPSSSRGNNRLGRSATIRTGGLGRPRKERRGEKESSMTTSTKRRKLNETKIEVVIPVSKRSDTIVVRSPSVSESEDLGDIEYASRKASLSQRIPSRLTRRTSMQRESTTGSEPTEPRTSISRRSSSSRPSSTRPESFPKQCFKLLFSITENIIDRNHLQRSEGWQNLAAEYRDIDRSANDWETAWKDLVLPEWCVDNERDMQDVLRELQDDEAQYMDASARRQIGMEAEQADDSDTQSSGERIRCSQCMTTESTRWRLDKERKPVCQECRHMLRAGKMVRPSMAWTEVGDDSGIRRSIEGNDHNEEPQPIVTTRADVGVQTSPIASPSTPQHQLDGFQTFDPGSSLVSRAPGANEARKRTPGRTSQSTSQDTAKSGQTDGKSKSQLPVNGETETIEILETFQEQESLVFQAGQSATKRRRLQDDPNSLEIPPTPEHIQTSSGAFDARGNQNARGMTPVEEESESDRSESLLYASLEPKAIPEGTPPTVLHVASREASEESESEAEGSPLFVPQDKSTTRADSQPAVNLFSEPDDAPVTSSQQQPTDDDIGSEAETQSQGYAFETAPDLSNDWQTAPETQAKNKARLETQALIAGAASNVDVTDFDLPEPPGGWDLIEESYMNADDNDDDEEDNASIDEDSQDGTDASSETDPTERWYQDMRSLYADTTGVNEVLLHCLKATGFDYRLSTEVLARAVEMSNTKRARGVRERDGILLPDDILGCYTTMDDEKLMRDDARGIAEMHAKHGSDSCMRRFETLEMYAEMGI